MLMKEAGGMYTVLRAGLVAALIVWAGCTAKEPADDLPMAEFGTISGVAVNPNVEPVGGAMIELEPGGQQAQSDMFGRFRFEDVPPGSYQLAARAEGHEAATMTLPITAGETSRPRVVLQVAAVAEARHETLEFQGYIPAGFGPVDGEAEFVKQMVGDCTCRFAISTPPATVAVVVEVVWTPNLERPDEPTRLRWEADVENNTLEGNGTSPLNAVIDQGLGAGFFLHILPDEVWPLYDQGFQLFMTTWEVDPPPAGWSYVRGDA